MEPTTISPCSSYSVNSEHQQSKQLSTCRKQTPTSTAATPCVLVQQSYGRCGHTHPHTLMCTCACKLLRPCTLLHRAGQGRLGNSQNCGLGSALCLATPHSACACAHLSARSTIDCIAREDVARLAQWSHRQGNQVTHTHHLRTPVWVHALVRMVATNPRAPTSPGDTTAGGPPSEAAPPDPTIAGGPERMQVRAVFSLHTQSRPGPLCWRSQPPHPSPTSARDKQAGVVERSTQRGE